MAHLISSWSKTAKTVPEDYIVGPGLGAEKDAPICKEIPVIDLSLAMGSEVDRTKVADQILKALDEYRCFQVINHGVSKKLMEDAVEVYQEFFNLPVEDKEKYVNGDTTAPVKTGLFTGSEVSATNVKLWRDVLLHRCYPLEKQVMDFWPDKPAEYRKLMVEYVSGTRKLIQMIFKLIGEGLGLEKEQLDVKILGSQTLRTNYYPKSPDPSLTSGFTAHYDPNVVTLLQQNVPGLQIFKDGKWLLVQPIPNAFFVLTGMDLQIISNGKFKAVLHQVATNAVIDRLSIGIFTSAADSTGGAPDKAFISNGNPPKYKDFSMQEYMKRVKQFFESSPASIADVSEAALDSFLVKD